MARTVKRLRVLALLDRDLVPPASLRGHSDAEIYRWRTEYDVVSTLKAAGHEVHPLVLTLLRPLLQYSHTREAFVLRGIGNRPGATQMNSGFRWPYGRREGVLPVWAHRRLESPDAQPFRRVIFQNRSSEGFASRTSDDHSVDDYYCLSFDQSSTGRDALDAVTCASVFSSDKGRFMTKQDLTGGYGEPYEDPVTFAGAARASTTTPGVGPVGWPRSWDTSRSPSTTSATASGCPTCRT